MTKGIILYNFNSYASNILWKRKSNKNQTYIYGNKRDFFKTRFFEWSPNEILIPLMFIMVGKKLWHIYCVLLTYSLEKKSFGLGYPHILQHALYLINYTSLTNRIKLRL